MEAMMPATGVWAVGMSHATPIEVEHGGCYHTPCRRHTSEDMREELNDTLRKAGDGRVCIEREDGVVMRHERRLFHHARYRVDDNAGGRHARRKS